MLVVLAVSFFASAAYAILDFVYDLVHMPARQPEVIDFVAPAFDPYNFAHKLIGALTLVAPVLLVAHLLARDGGSIRDLGFDRTRPRSDLAWGTLLMLITHVIGLAIVAVGRAIDAPFRMVFFVNSDANTAAASVVIVLGSAATAIAEEVVVNAYLITRLRQMGRSAGVALAVSTALRASYHLYQGWQGAAGNVLIGIVAGAIFLRTRRIMPLVIAHFLVDIVAGFGSLFFSDYLEGFV